MPGRKLTPLGVIAKWLVVPVALGAAGFYVIGPRMGQVAPKLADTVAGAAAPKPSFTAPDIDVDSVPASRYNPAPDVEISAKERRPRKRRRRSHPVVVENDSGKQPVDQYVAPANSETPKPATGPDGV